jgi:hypothetical protein
MKKNLAQLFHWPLYLIGLIVLVIFLNFAFSLQPPASSRGNGIQALQKRLLQLGIPVKSVTVTKQSPLEIEVILNSSGSDGKLSRDDFVNEFLAVREVELAYLNFATFIKSYRLVLVTADGNTPYDGTIYLDPDFPSQKLTQAPPSTVDAGKTKAILDRSLDLQGLKLLSLDIPARYIASDNSKLVTLDLSTGISADKTDSAQIGEILMSLRPQMEHINNLHGTRLVLIHIRIKDSGDKLLVDYMEDIETGRQDSWIDENYVAGWYPQPVPEDSAEQKKTPVPVVLPTATPSTSTTLPTPTAQPAVYPPPLIPNPYP